MTFTTTHRARVTGPVPYNTGVSDRQHVPLGACLIEQQDEKSIDIIWGTYGQKSVTLPVEALQSAQDQGNLVLLD